MGQIVLPCALGRAGRRPRKREGDGATPVGTWRVRAIYYRADRQARPRSGCAPRPLRPAAGWCDAPTDRNYNRPVNHPYPASAERLWRDDALYDIIVVLGYNDRPRVRGRGSAIFMHLAASGYSPTEGCIALGRRQLLRVVAQISHRSRVTVT